MILFMAPERLAPIAQTMNKAKIPQRAQHTLPAATRPSSRRRAHLSRRWVPTVKRPASTQLWPAMKGGVQITADLDSRSTPRGEPMTR